jgi:hypothetical protein
MAPEAERKRLPNVKLSPSNRPLEFWVSPRSKDEFDLAAPYQRGSVWGLGRRRELVKSLLMGLPIGAVIVSELPYRAGRASMRVVDGKQRVETVTGFVAGAFTVPGWWFPEDSLTPEAAAKEEVGYADLSQAGRFRLGNLPFPSLEFNGQVEYLYRAPGGKNWVTRDRTDEEILALEAEIFELVNFGGVAHTEADRQRAPDVAAHPERSEA